MTLTSGQIYCAFSGQIVVRRATADDIDPVCRLVEVSPMAAQWSPGQVVGEVAGGVESGGVIVAKDPA